MNTTHSKYHACVRRWRYIYDDGVNTRLSAERMYNESSPLDVGRRKYDVTTCGAEDYQPNNSRE